MATEIHLKIGMLNAFFHPFDKYFLSTSICQALFQVLEIPLIPTFNFHGDYIPMDLQIFTNKELFLHIRIKDKNSKTVAIFDSPFLCTWNSSSVKFSFEIFNTYFFFVPIFS